MADAWPLAVFGGALLGAGVTLALALRAYRRQRAEMERTLARAKASEETLQLAVSAASEYLWDGDLRSNVITGSPEAGEWLGYPPHEWPPTPWNRIVHEDDRARVDEEIARAMRGETRTYRVRHRLRRRDGTVLHALSTGMVLRDATGRPLRFVGFVRDMTREVTEDERTLQAQKLEGLGQLAGGIAHDFNNLLTVIGASLELASSRAAQDPRLLEPLDTAMSAHHRAAALTRQLLAYAGHAPVAPRAVDLNALLSSSLELVKVALPRGVSVKYELADSVPAVQGDPAQLQQVVLNLVTNAGEASGGATGVVTVQTTVVDHPRCVRLIVRDAGAGMTPDVQTRSLDPFFSTKGAGRGLGLAAVAGIAKTHRGTVGIDSAPGQGTTVTLTLPALDTAVVVTPPRSSSPSDAKLGLKVLVVDDEALLRRSARRSLEALGCTVDEAVTGRDAVERVTAAPAGWDVVLMDVTMPELNGIDAAEQLRRLAPGLPVILSSGYTAEQKQAAAGTLVLNKPYTREELEVVLRQAMQRSRAG
ncbi:MAG: response regulator [Archangiaceae bacterium]|nr:response regulator [Archangiaceae bacterium]